MSSFTPGCVFNYHVQQFNKEGTVSLMYSKCSIKSTEQMLSCDSSQRIFFMKKNLYGPFFRTVTLVQVCSSLTDILQQMMKRADNTLIRTSVQWISEAPNMKVQLTTKKFLIDTRLPDHNNYPLQKENV